MQSIILNDLNPQQKEAVISWKGPLLILAGAGSGKTRVLTHRIAYLVSNERVSPWQIMAVTFTNKAANEMRTRIETLLGASARDIMLGTFHSVCLRILRRESHHLGFENNFVVYDTDDQMRLMKNVFKDLHVNEKMVPIRNVLAKISAAKNLLIKPQNFLASVKEPSFYDEQISRLYEYYMKQLKLNSAMDFDDLILYPIELFKNFPEVLDRYQEKFKFVLVDEYQDTNHCQYSFINMIVQKYRNVCCVGDDDQSIYGWRGADINNILNFEKDYPEAKVIRLEQNYRSTGQILNAASSVVRNNKLRKGKELWTKNEVGNPITVFETTDERREADEVVQQIKKLKEQNESLNYSEFAVLYRTNAQSRVLEESFRWSKIPYTIVGGMRFYERKEIKDILAYLRIITNPIDSISLKRIINIPKRGIGNTTIDKISHYATNKAIDLFKAMTLVDQIGAISPNTRQKINQFVNMILRFQEKKDTTPPDELTHQLLVETGYYSELKTEIDAENESRLENVNELLNAMKIHYSESPEPTLESFLANVALVSDIDEWDDKQQSITLMTLHSAKGLEFPIVFITGVEEGLIPHAASIGEQDKLEEERRLFYVGITRAKKDLYFIHTRSRSRYGYDIISNTPSRFLKEIPENCYQIHQLDTEQAPVQQKAKYNYFTKGRKSIFDDLKPIPEIADANSDLFKIGDQVRHTSWGDGEIINSEGSGDRQKVTIRFSNQVEKKVMVKFANLQKI